MISLEQTIQEAARTGRLQQVLLVRTPSGKWQASTPSNYATGAYAVAVSDDPVDCLMRLLRDQPAPAAPSIFD